MRFERRDAEVWRSEAKAVHFCFLSSPSASRRSINLFFARNLALALPAKSVVVLELE
jgi:hypothetical protein